MTSYEKIKNMTIEEMAESVLDGVSSEYRSDELARTQELAMGQLSELLHKSELNPEDDLCAGMTYDGDRILEMRIRPLKKMIEEI